MQLCFLLIAHKLTKPVTIQHCHVVHAQQWCKPCAAGKPGRLLLLQDGKMNECMKLFEWQSVTCMILSDVRVGLLHAGRVLGFLTDVPVWGCALYGAAGVCMQVIGQSHIRKQQLVRCVCSLVLLTYTAIGNHEYAAHAAEGDGLATHFDVTSPDRGPLCCNCATAAQEAGHSVLQVGQ